MSLRIKSANTMVLGDKTYIMMEPEKYSDIQAFKKVAAEMKPDKAYTVDIKQYRSSRSLNANNYAWKIITELANVLRYSKEDVYIDMLKKYGQSEIISVLSDIGVTGYLKYFEEAGGSELNGKAFTHYKVYKGSSEFDTYEMSVLIDGIVQEAKAQGIETLTPEELSRLKEDWG